MAEAADSGKDPPTSANSGKDKTAGNGATGPRGRDPTPPPAAPAYAWTAYQATPS